MPTPVPTPVYVERVAAPASWWVVTGLAVLAVTLTLSVAPVWVLAVVPPLATVGAVLALRAYALLVLVDDAGLTVGRAHLPWTAIGTVEPLGPEAAAVLRGRGADPRAFLGLRSYAPTAVRVGVADPGDPTPYWYVSTRHPDALAEALALAPSADGSPGAGRAPS